ncbi:hypothetical protein [Hymenobacter tenuis]
MNPNQYDGLLQRPFLAEHWHKGVAAALAIWLPAFMCAYYFLHDFVAGAVGFATTVSLAIILVVVTQYEGFTLNLTSLRYRRYTWVAGLRFGRWLPLPPIVQVTVRYVQKNHHLPLDNHPAAVGFTATERVWQVLLRVEQSPIGIVVANTQQEKALHIARTLATLLHREVVVHS